MHPLEPRRPRPVRGLHDPMHRLTASTVASLALRHSLRTAPLCFTEPVASREFVFVLRKQPVDPCEPLNGGWRMLRERTTNCSSVMFMTNSAFPSSVPAAVTHWFHLFVVDLLRACPFVQGVRIRIPTNQSSRSGNADLARSIDSAPRYEHRASRDPAPSIT